MYTIKLDINDSIYDKVMLFLKNIPVQNLVVEKKEEAGVKKKDDIVHFFQSSPLAGEIELERDLQTYTDRVCF